MQKDLCRPLTTRELPPLCMVFENRIIWKLTMSWNTHPIGVFVISDALQAKTRNVIFLNSRSWHVTGKGDLKKPNIARMYEYLNKYFISTNESELTSRYGTVTYRKKRNWLCEKRWQFSWLKEENKISTMQQIFWWKEENGISVHPMSSMRSFNPWPKIAPSVRQEFFVVNPIVRSGNFV